VRANGLRVGAALAHVVAVPAFPRPRRRADAVRATAILLALVGPGCRTRPYDAIGPGASEALDASAILVADLLGVTADLVARDATIPPPADLIEPVACANIFVVDGTSSMLSTFDPLTARFSDLFQVRCPSASAPDAMAITHDGATVFIEYQDGNFFRVGLADGKCQATPYREQFGLDGVVGMSFSSDTPGGAAETLYLAGGQDLVLARRDLGTFVDTRIGGVPAFLELSGTGAGDLWGFFPVGGGTPEAYIARIDKATAALGPHLQLPTLPPNQGDFTFAAWGGAFWVFQEESGSTSVFRVDAASGQVTPVATRTGRHVIGSGTSSCAPVGLDR
jgi:hypothetical protein